MIKRLYGFPQRTQRFHREHREISSFVSVITKSNLTKQQTIILKPVFLPDDIVHQTQGIPVVFQPVFPSFFQIQRNV